MSLRKSLRRSLRSSYKVKSSDEGGQVRTSDAVTSSPAKMASPASTTEQSKSGAEGGGVTLDASNSSFESHEDITATGAYHSSESEDDLIEMERQDEAACPDSALYEFIFRACALMALENDELKQMIEQQQIPKLESGAEQEAEQEPESRRQSDAGALMKQDGEGSRKKSKKQKATSSSELEDDEGGIKKRLNK